MQRTTLNLHDTLADKLRHLAAAEHTSLSAIINRLLTDALNEKRKTRRGKPPVEWPTYASGAPAVSLGDREALFARMDEP